MQDLIDNGFTYECSDTTKPLEEIDGKKFIPLSIHIMKGKEQYATVGLINTTGGKLKLEDIKAKFTDKITHEDEKDMVFNDGKNAFDFQFDDQKVLESVTLDINEHNM